MKNTMIKTKKLLMFEPDALTIEYVVGLQYYYYLIAYKNGQKFYIQGYENEEKGKEKLNSLIEAIKNGETYLEIGDHKK